jgi:serine/threonine-protein kinase
VVQGGFNSAAGVREGDVLAGKYRVERLLGTGGMGVVVAAHHIQLDQRVALKFLLPSALGNPESVARFAREARAAVKIQSEHVVRVIDVGALPDGAPYMVMECLEGRDLAAWLKESGPLPVEQAVEFVLQACLGLADAHALGIVHRDLKPANLFCVRRSDGQLSIKILDFGISKMTDAKAFAPEVSVTATKVMIGSPLYMSPEQMESSKRVDAQTDIWALGGILFELMAGRPAFLCDSLPELAHKLVHERPPAIRSFRSNVPGELEAIVFKCLEKERRRRYPNVAELARALEPFAPPRARASVDRISGILEVAGLSVTEPSAHVPGDSLPPVGRITVAPASRRTTNLIEAALAGAVVVLGIVGTVLLVTRPTASGGDPRTAGAAPPSVAVSSPAAEDAAPPRASPMLSPPPSASVALPQIPTLKKKLPLSVPVPVATHVDEAPPPSPSAASSAPATLPKVQLERDNPWP